MAFRNGLLHRADARKRSGVCAHGSLQHKKPVLLIETTFLDAAPIGYLACQLNKALADLVHGLPTLGGVGRQAFFQLPPTQPTYFFFFLAISFLATGAGGGGGSVIATSVAAFHPPSACFTQHVT